MNDAQHRFRRGRSTESAWARVKDYVRMSENKYIPGVFVDFKNTFDNLEWTRAIEKLCEIGCEEMSLWRSYFQGRRACMVGVNDVVWKKVEKRLSTGVHLWSIYIELHDG